MSDPITNIFVNRQPTMTEIGDALAKSLSSRNYASPSQAAGVSFGEALNNIRGAKIKEAVQLEGIRQGRERLDISKEQLDLTRQKIDLEQAKLKAPKFIGDIDTIYGENAPDVVAGLHALPYPVDTNNRQSYMQEASKVYTHLKNNKMLLSQQSKDRVPKYATYTFPPKKPGGKAIKETVNENDPRIMQQVLAKGGVKREGGITASMTTPEGSRFVFSTGGDAPEMGKPPASLIDSLQQQHHAAEQGLRFTTRVIDSINADRGRAGLPGAFKSFAQNAVGIAEDLSVYMPGMGDFLQRVSQTLREEIGGGQASQTTAAFFDPELPTMEIIENALAYRLARASKGPGRLNVQDVAEWKNLIGIRGLTDIDAVLARFDFVKMMFEDEKGNLAQRLKSFGKDPLSEGKTAKDYSTEELRAMRGRTQ